MRLPTIFIDVIFLLLLQYFSISTLTMYNSSANGEQVTPEIDLPSADSADAKELRGHGDEVVVLSARPRRAGEKESSIEYFLSGRESAYNSIEEIRTAIQESRPLTMVLRVDGRLTHATTVELLMTAADAGVRKTSIAYDQADESP